MGQIKVTKAPIEGLYIIEPAVHGDSRGYFMETYNQKDMEENGLNMVFVQDNQSMSTKGVLRGLHFQKEFPQGKLVRVIKGAVYDVAVDLRSGSETYGKWYGVELTEENKKQFYISEGFAHGFLVLSDTAEFCYKVTDFYHPGPYHFPEKLIPLMIVNALNDKPLPVYGEGLNVRDWLYVEDHCKAIDLIIHKGRVGEVYNVGGHNEKQNIEIVKIICKELGKPESLITHVGDRKGHDMRYAIDPTKIHNELGWLPETKFEDGIKKTIQWYLDNREWWETIISGEYQNYYEKMYGNR